MFTGIVQGLAAVTEVQAADNFKSFKIQFPAGKVDGIKIGASVAINGTCLTVTAIEQDVLSFDVMMETLRATSLGQLQVMARAAQHDPMYSFQPCVCSSTRLCVQFVHLSAYVNNNTRTSTSSDLGSKP